jgi:hypothetical protein
MESVFGFCESPNTPILFHQGVLVVAGSFLNDDTGETMLEHRVQRILPLVIGQLADHRRLRAFHDFVLVSSFVSVHFQQNDSYDSHDET